ncbi:MAG: lactate racemase domain-containing protein [Spirochaetia bacterium]|jgi:hypothetical protein|nr:lactate racemase domain-containing protein [Spirochaetia bacterium]
MEKFPELIKIKQKLDDEHIKDLESHVKNECGKIIHLFKGDRRIAIGAGSRGISNYALILKTIIKYFQDNGFEMIIVPAMGSHGGATAEGQLEVLESYGITEEAMGTKILSSMEVVELDSSGLENKVYVDRNAYECDSIIIMNRIKAHTDFAGEIESGLIKMCCIGLGKHKLALEIHSFGGYGLDKLLLPTAMRVARDANVKAGFAIVENPYHKTKIFKALKPDEFYAEEKKLLKTAIENIAQLPVSKLDILCVDEMGKNISGIGIDPNVTGDLGIRGLPPKTDAEIRIIVVDDLTEESHGNAIGVGQADIITEKLYKKINFEATYENVITSAFLERGRVPIVKKTYEDALRTAIQVSGKKPEDVRMVRIRNTQEMSFFYVSKPVYEEIKNNKNYEAASSFVKWEETDKL